MEQPQSSSAQQITPADQLVNPSNHETVKMCNNKVILLNITCPKESRIIRQLLADHALSHALTATADVLAVVVNKVLVDYASLLWSDFLYCVMQKKNVIQYPRFTKLIIADLIEKYESIPKRLKEEYHTIKDDTLLVNVREVMFTQDISKDKDQEKESTPTTPLPPSDDQEKDDIIEATQLSLALDKIAKVYEEQQNMAAIENKNLEEGVEKLVEGGDEFDGDEFADTVLLSDGDSSDRIEPRSHKEKLEEIINDDDDDKHDDAKDDKDDDDHDDHSLIKTQRMGSSEIRTEKM
ncbi:hypothetical protein Tco_1019143 [Tanacetum coccineum]|uniref:Uncharacterized protein n=1 Tax=Tanacetum coccineum TaxID=301880 RepID=A0ABQ5FWC3_9ASTR